MLLTRSTPSSHHQNAFAPSFRSWQRDSLENGILPVIGIAGTRGKSTTARILNAIFTRAHLRTALWTNLGVEIRGKRQRGELAGWSLALSRLAESTIDVAIQELHWSTVNAVGLPPTSYPALAITTARGATDAPLESVEMEAALRGSRQVSEAAHEHGFLVVNGDDYQLSDEIEHTAATVIVTALSRESPILRRHLAEGGAGAWVSDRGIYLGTADRDERICSTDECPITLDGEASYQAHNVLTALAIAAAVGIDLSTIRDAISRFRTTPAILPGSSNIFDQGVFRAVVDQSGPSWYLRPLIRAVNPHPQRRLITVLGDLAALPEADLPEVGRLLGRHHGAIILHSNQDEALVEHLRRGIASNAYPPVVVHTTTERKAINRALKTVRADDVVVFLTQDDPGPSIRAIERKLDASIQRENNS